MRHLPLIGTATLGVGLLLACGGGTAASTTANDNSLEYTQWTMEFTVGEDETYTIDFLPAGQYMVDGETGKDQTWTMTGDEIALTEDNYRYVGRMVDGYTIGGTVTQLEDGESWPFRMTRTR